MLENNILKFPEISQRKLSIFQKMIFQELETVRKEVRVRTKSVLTRSKKKRSLFQLRLGDRRLRGLHDCRLGGGRHSDQRTEMQARLEPPGRS